MSGETQRQLAAILVADVAGFSRLMQADEAGTTARIVDLQEHARVLVETHAGLVVSTAGDSLLGRFASVLDAVTCARAIQEATAKANDGVNASEQILLRIGIHLGDVLVTETDVFGDGVNVAARLEPLAEPGGIAVSEAVHSQVRGKIDLDFEHLGSRRLKHIADPVSVYRVAPSALGISAAPPKAVEASHRPITSVVLASSTLILTAAGVAGLVADTVGWSGWWVWSALGGMALGTVLDQIVAAATGGSGLGRGLGFAWVAWVAPTTWVRVVFALVSLLNLGAFARTLAGVGDES